VYNLANVGRITYASGNFPTTPFERRHIKVENTNNQTATQNSRITLNANDTVLQGQSDLASGDGIQVPSGIFVFTGSARLDASAATGIYRVCLAVNGNDIDCHSVYKGNTSDNIFVTGTMTYEISNGATITVNIFNYTSSDATVIETNLSGTRVAY